jgi:hypothetical protein
MAAMASHLRPMGRMTHYCFLAVVFGFILRADNEFTIPLDDGSGIAQGIVVALKLVPKSTFAFGELNCTTAWCVGYEIRRFGRLDILERPLSLKLQFDQGGLCKGVPGQWSEFAEEVISGMRTKRGGFHLEDADGCTIEILDGALVSAKIGTKVLVQQEPSAPDFTDRLKAIQNKRVAEEARLRKAAEERKQKAVKDATRAAQLKAEEDAKAAEERRKMRVACMTVYQATIDKKVKDLTVREEQQVRACQVLNLYPPK